ncbi:fibroin heavy chain-like [Penaeus japonicus]|uniref:fibroin heavy chain-like n=1 Tax=Penaeus japonicus TaxID=27405 RepID=UPI001C716F95|nr:fibroin heavy chain-like [Penaeus japonicus]
MRFLVLACALAATTTAAPQGYSLQRPAGSTLSTGPGQTAGSGFSVGTGAEHAGASGVVIGSGHGVGNGVSAGLAVGGGLSAGSGHGVGIVGISGEGAGILEPCEEGQVRHVDGSCVTPVVSRKVFVFDVPEQKEPVGPPPSLPPPTVEHNILFVRLPEEGEGPEPIVVPPPRQENIVYVLNKKGEQSQRVIEVPAHPPTDPEIYFVNYEEGENPTLPIGVDLNTALGSAAEAGGQVIGAASAGLGGSIGGAGGSSGLGTISGGLGGTGAGIAFGTVSGGLGGSGAGTGFGTVNGGFAGGNVGSSSSFQVGGGVCGYCPSKSAPVYKNWPLLSYPVSVGFNSGQQNYKSGMLPQYCITHRKLPNTYNDCVAVFIGD